MIKTSLGVKIRENRKYHYFKKKVTQKTEGRQSFCLAVGEVQKAGDTEHHTITETLTVRKTLYIHFDASRVF